MKILKAKLPSYKEDICHTFSNLQTTICPYCFQDTTENYKVKLLAEISKIFNNESAQNYQDKITKFKHRLIDKKIRPDIEHCNIINSELVSKIETKTLEYNNYIDTITEKLDDKYLNIYEPIIDFIVDLSLKLEEINSNLTTLESCRETFNSKILTLKKEQDTLGEISKKINYLENLPLWKKYQQEEKKKIIISKNHDQLLTIQKSVASKIDKLNAEKANISIAVNLINDHLTYIFFSPNRLQLRIDGNQYAVHVNSNPIPLQKLSEGEKNAIALCYFFSLIFEGKKKEDFYKNEYFLVLDDPISSFDYQNKIGIFSFLRKILKTIFGTNSNSRVLIFTHQIDSLFHFKHLSDDIEITPLLWTMREDFLNKEEPLETFTYKKYNEYTLLLNQIFEYASGTNGFEKHDNTIGNTIRRVLELFGTFNYKAGIEHLTRKEEILNLINDIKQRDHFRNLMYRLVLNSESHYQQQGQGLPEVDLYEITSQKEKIRTAQEVLIFLSLINPLHLKSHLTENDPLGPISTWAEKIFSTSPS